MHRRGGRDNQRRFGAAGTVEPVLQMSGIINWLKPDTIIQSAGAVTNWVDASGQTGDYSQGTGANQPTYLSSYLNGRPGVHFDSTLKFLTAANNAKYNVGQNSFLYLLVGEWTGASIYQCFWGKGSNASGDHLRLMKTNTDPLTTFWGTDAQGYGPSAFTWPVTTPRVIGFGFDAAAVQTIYVSNGTINRTNAAASGTGSNSSSPRLNGDTSGGYVGTFKQAESAFYARGAVAFSDAEIATVVSGLRAKYGI